MPQIVFNIDPLLAVADDPISATLFLIENGAWVIFLIFFFWVAKQLWYNHIWGSYVTKNLRPVLLAIDVPRRSIQTAKAVENIFAHLAGAHGSSTRREAHLEGKIQEWFSLEIVSIDGYIQFLAWTWDKYRDLVETAIYAQYPDAQITEVEDYSKAVPHKYPDDEWDFWGTDFRFYAPQAYPIRTWPQFEHQGQKEEAFKDPLAAMLENMARIAPGEQMWFQILVRPIAQDWQKESAKFVKKLIGAKVPEAKSIIDPFLNFGGKIIETVLAETIGWGAGEPEVKRNEPESRMLHLSPGERAAVEAVDMKAAKIGFDVKVRAVYVGRKEVFKKQHGAHAVIGAIKQLNTNDLNGLKPDFKHSGPGSLFFFKSLRNNYRKTRLVNAYTARSMYVGGPTYVMNIEELATLWHFPTEAVHAPLIAKTVAKRAVPPTGLPMEAMRMPIEKKVSLVGGKTSDSDSEGKKRELKAPEELPFVD
ncbi:MAG: hypothetical protein ABIG71_01795 [Candidatus Uhrbacteria bacterium]